MAPWNGPNEEKRESAIVISTNFTFRTQSSEKGERGKEGIKEYSRNHTEADASVLVGWRKT